MLKFSIVIFALALRLAITGLALYGVIRFGVWCLRAAGVAI